MKEIKHYGGGAVNLCVCECARGKCTCVQWCSVFAVCVCMWEGGGCLSPCPLPWEPSLIVYLLIKTIVCH